MFPIWGKISVTIGYIKSAKATNSKTNLRTWKQALLQIMCKVQNTV